MSSLLSLFHLGANSIGAHSAGVSVSNNNVANADTEGYSRQRVDLRAELASPLVGGVRAEGAYRYDNEVLAGRLRDSGGALGMSRAFSQALMSLESDMTAPGADVAGATTALFDRFSKLAAAPMDGFERDATVEAARKLASSVRRQFDAVEQARMDANERIRDRAAEATRLARQIADINRAVPTSDDPALLDKRDQAAQELANLVGGRARVDGDGQMRFVLPGGAVLVDGPRAASLEATPDANLDDMLRLEAVDGNHRVDVTDQIQEGEIGGDLAFRDDTAVKSQGQIDQLAHDLSTEINAVHRNHAGLDGNTGRDLFVEPTQVDGAASAMAVDSAVAADSDLLATAAPGAGPGDNQGALALSGLSDQKLAAGGTRTFADAGIDVVAGVGHEAARAGTNLDMQSAVHDNLVGMRDSLAGVSIQEELTRLSEFQHAVEASTRYLRTVDEMLGTIINTL